MGAEFKGGYIRALMVFLVLPVMASRADSGINVQPNSFDVNIPEGCTSTEILTIRKTGGGSLDFTIRTRPVSGSMWAGQTADRLSITAKSTAGNIPTAHDFTVADDARYKEGELLVRFAVRPDKKPRSISEKNQVLSAAGGGKIKHNYKIVPDLSVVELPAGITVKEALKIFNKTNGILYAQPNYEVHALSTFPNDPRFSELWGMHNTGQTGGTPGADINAPEAWDIGTGSGGIVVAVIDTGVDYTHPDLAANMWVNVAEQNGQPGVDDDGNGYVDDIYGYDFCNNDGNPMDDHFHGTHCAGTIGGVGNNAAGVAGVNWHVKIMALKFLDSSGYGYTDNAVKCVEYSVLMGAKLSSNSWGGGGYDQALKDAIDAAGVAGMLFVAAAGNNASNNDSHPFYPSSYDCASLISVMATDKYDQKAGFSCYGATSVDLGAPGVDILSCQPANRYQLLSGTSMATPHVGGACALLWSMNPAMSNSEVKDILLRTVEPTLPGLCVSGGRLNLYKAMVETKVPWLKIEPESGTIGPGHSIDINVTFDAMELAPGTYEAEIMIVSNDPQSPKIVSVTLTVHPDDLQVSPTVGLASSGLEGGPFEPNRVVYTLANNSAINSVNWKAQGLANWLDVVPSEGIIGPGETADVNVSISAGASLLDPNLYTQTLTFQNINSNSVKPRPITLMVNATDRFTEVFDASGSDLNGMMVTFRPDGSAAYYEACRDRVVDFPTDPNGGTYVELGDDDFAEIVPSSGKNILFYGTSYDRFYIGSNGYITFGQGDTEPNSSLSNHFKLPRISGMFANLIAADGNCISYKDLNDRMAVTFQNVPLSRNETVKFSFQIEMFYADGTIRITWLDAAKTACIAGLSRGRSIATAFFKESNLNEYPACWPQGDFNRNYVVNFNDFVLWATHWLEEHCNMPYWCGRSDLDFSGIADFTDLSKFCDNWLTEVDWFLQPIAHWKLDEGSGNTAYDSVGTNDGTIYGARWTGGRIGGALDFDGIDDMVVIPDNDLLTPANAMTLSFWTINRNGKDTGVYKLAFCPGEPASPGNSRAYQFNITGSIGKAYFKVLDSVNNGDYLESIGTVSANQWHLITATFDNGAAKIYIDGQLDTSKTMTVTSIMNDVQPLIIGGMWSYCGTPDVFGASDGVIDDVRIYDRALSANEIAKLYQDGQRLPGQAANPNPSDGAVDIGLRAKLKWTADVSAASHDVYFGANPAPGTDEFKGNQAAPTYDPGILMANTTYHWRIDEKNDAGTTTGTVWNFTTRDAVDDVNLIGWWKLDEGSGNTAYDYAGANDGTIDGAQWTGGKLGGALDFDGIDDKVVIPDNDVLTPANAMTLSFWAINRNGKETGVYKIASCPGEPASPGNSRAYQLNVYGSTGKAVFKALDSVNHSDFLESIGTVSANQWHLITATFDRGAAKIYIDGQLDNSKTMTVTSIMNDVQPLIIGGWWYYCGTPDAYGASDGVIDDVRLYNRILSGTEIWELYQQGSN